MELDVLSLYPIVYSNTVKPLIGGPLYLKATSNRRAARLLEVLRYLNKQLGKEKERLTPYRDQVKDCDDMDQGD
jgi:hypothetical protein